MGARCDLRMRLVAADNPSVTCVTAPFTQGSLCGRDCHATLAMTVGDSRSHCRLATNGRPYKGLRDLSGTREACCLSGGGTPPLQNVVLGKQKKEKWV
jgi:hypothetical protein